MKAALLLVDLQNDFCTGGTLAVNESEHVIDVANKAMAICQQKQIDIIASQDWHPATHLSFAANSNTQIGEVGELNGITQVWWPIHCVQGEHGAKLHSDLNQSLISATFTKGETHRLIAIVPFSITIKLAKPACMHGYKNNTFHI